MRNAILKLVPAQLKFLVRNQRLLLSRFMRAIGFWLRDRAGDPSQELIEHLKQLNAHFCHHSGCSFLSHLIGTYKLLRDWKAPEAVCLAGLYHSIYGTQTFRESLAQISQRDEIELIIGNKAEKLAYYFCLRDEKHFWSNLNRTANFSLKDRFRNQEIPLTEQEFRNLLEICLADHLEQMHYWSNPYWLKDRFLKSKSFLRSQAYNAFLRAYQN